MYVNMSEAILIDDDDSFAPKKYIYQNCDSESTLKNENKELFSSLLDICWSLENSDGMTRVLNKTLLPLYESIDRGYRKSKSFKKVLQNTIQKLQTNSSQKFSYIKELCETLKCHLHKKRVQLIHLDSNLSKKRRTTYENETLKENEILTINLEEETSDIVPVISIDEDSNDVIFLEEQCADTEQPKENKVQNGDSPVSKNLTQHLTPFKEKIVVDIDENNEKQKKINNIEIKIAKTKAQLHKLEQQEVSIDNNGSPYIICHKLKSKILNLYQELCDLTGSQTKRNCSVRLNVAEGHPTGPVMKLEKFLKDSADVGNELQFPDFSDVLQCVNEANEEDRLGWSKSQIHAEARRLFIQCGRFLQKRRQKREWRDLLTTVKLETEDPADFDPELNAKLAMNRKLGRMKEEKVFEMYTQLQNSISKKNNSYIEKSKQNELIQPLSDTSNTLCVDAVSNKINSTEEKNNLETKTDSNENMTIENNNLKSIERMDSAHSDNLTKIKLEKEDVDVLKILDEFGDNYTATVFDIEDPYLIIEISDSDEDS